MDEDDKLTAARKDIKSVSDDRSWFRDTPHYWAEASLPLAYAVACVEVVTKNSEKARILYSKLIEAWSDAGIKAMGDKITSIIPESGKEKIRKAVIHPETELLPDPNRPFRKLEEMFTGPEINEDFLKDDVMEELTPEEKHDAEQLANLESLIEGFIIVGFNRESDIEKGRYRVIPSEKAPWLLWAIAIRTALESYKITFERVRDFYKVRKRKGKIIDFHKVLTEQPMSRLHRQMVASSKAVNLKLKNDRTIVEAARHWYQCRVVFPSINKYCDAFENYRLEPKNISKQIRPCDDAVGYMKRLAKKTNLVAQT